MSPLKIALKVAQVPDIKVKVKIEVETTRQSKNFSPLETIAPNTGAAAETDSSVDGAPQVPAGSFWQKLFSRLKFKRRKNPGR